MPRLSFVMPTKNRDYLIKNSIESIISQTFTDWELVIIDDHSDTTDKTEDVIKSFGDNRIKYYRMNEKQAGGIATARNFGNQIASAPIIVVVDSDDLCHPERAAETVKAFDESDCDVFYSKYEILFQETGELRERKTPIVPFDLAMMKQFNIVPHATSAYKKDLAWQYPYNSFFRIGEDYDFFTRLANDRKKFYFCDKILYRVIVHGQNITGGKKFVDIEKLIKTNRGWEELAEDRTETVLRIINQ